MSKNKLQRKGEEGVTPDAQRRVRNITHDEATGEYVDLDTGEVYEGVPVIYGKRTKMPEEFVMVFQAALQQVLHDWRDDELTTDAVRVLLFFMQRLSWENLVAIQQTEIAEQVGIHPSNVSRAISHLVKRGYVEKGPRNSHSYRLSLEIAWKGRAKNFKAEREASRQAGHLRIVNGGRTDENE